MLLSVVSVLVVAQSSSEVPEGLMNNPVLYFSFNLCLLFFQTATKLLGHEELLRCLNLTSE